jgi:hypothetical protein
MDRTCIYTREQTILQKTAGTEAVYMALKNENIEMTYDNKEQPQYKYHVK